MNSMMITNTYPVEKVTEVLLNLGRTADELNFDNGALRIGYWDTLTPSELKALGNLVESAESDYDDECGWLYWYNLTAIN